MTRLLAAGNSWSRLRGNSRLSATARIHNRPPVGAFIVYRRLTMNDQARPLARDTAAQYASWFRALADPTRVQILSLLARSGGPLTVGSITGAVDVGQSTVSAHLKVLAEVGFVLAERRGTSVRYRVNDRCVDRFPTAAQRRHGQARPGRPAERRRRAYDPQPPARRPRAARPADPPDGARQRRPGAGDLPGRAGHEAGQLRDHRPILGATSTQSGSPLIGTSPPNAGTGQVLGGPPPSPYPTGASTPG